MSYRIMWSSSSSSMPEKRRKENNDGAGSSSGGDVVLPRACIPRSPPPDDDMGKRNKLYSYLDMYLPDTMTSPHTRHTYMRNMVDKYLPHTHFTSKLREYRQSIMSRYQPLHRELYEMNPTNFFVPSFLEAIKDNKEESFRNIIHEPIPGLLTFEMLQPNFCEMLLAEVQNFQEWICKTDIRVMRPSTMSKYGTVLDDIGLEPVLHKLMIDFIQPISRVFFPEVSGAELDSHHGFVVEYEVGKDVDLGLHVDDAEVTLNVCLGKQFSGGDLFFRGVRCEKHMGESTRPEEVKDYIHVRGWAIVHRGRHRHGARAVISGQRANLVLWCKSSEFREQKKYFKVSDWCGACQCEKEESRRQSLTALRKELQKDLMQIRLE